MAKLTKEAIASLKTENPSLETGDYIAIAVYFVSVLIVGLLSLCRGCSQNEESTKPGIAGMTKPGMTKQGIDKTRNVKTRNVKTRNDKMRN